MTNDAGSVILSGTIETVTLTMVLMQKMQCF